MIKNQHLSGSQVLSIEIIGEKFREKIYPQSVQFLQHELITSEFEISKIFLKIKKIKFFLILMKLRFNVNYQHIKKL